MIRKVRADSSTPWQRAVWSCERLTVGLRSRRGQRERCGQVGDKKEAKRGRDWISRASCAPSNGEFTSVGLFA